MMAGGATAIETMAVAMIFSYSASRCAAVSTLESFSPSGTLRWLRITAETTTGPASGPRPTSSTPQTNFAPRLMAARSNLSVGLLMMTGESDGMSSSIASWAGDASDSSVTSAGSSDALIAG